MADRVFTREDGQVMSAPAGSALELVLETDADWLEVVSGGGAKPPPETDEPDRGVDLSTLKRDELNRLAADVGVDQPDRLPNRQAVIDAIGAHTG